MKTACSRQWLFVAAALALSGVRTTADDANFGEPLIQTRFDQLISTSYPTIAPRFGEPLIQTRFDQLISTSYPTITPRFDRLIQTQDQPLLIVNEGLGQLPAIGPKRKSIPELRQTSASRHAPPRTGGKTR